ncbi:hypothetical protein F5883DRAFT_579362 [Diaporthe sp. PMI_573]|nr:hypothetical protein F5883DRAFT_579362 [Diaporthaceae sp. PMI_573]
MMGAPAFLRANRWCGMVAVTSCLGGFLVLGVSTQTRAALALPCPAGALPYQACSDSAAVSNLPTVHLMLLCLSHQDILAFRHPKSIALTCILEAFFPAHGAR